jgi:hypothetical protein
MKVKIKAAAALAARHMTNSGTSSRFSSVGTKPKDGNQESALVMKTHETDMAIGKLASKGAAKGDYHR